MRRSAYPAGPSSRNHEPAHLPAGHPAASHPARNGHNVTVMDEGPTDGTPLSGGLVLVDSTSSVTDGHLLRGRLEADGIPVVLKGEGEGPYRMGPVHVYVPVEFEVQALMLIEEIRSGRLRVRDGEDLAAETDWANAEREPYEG
jgi:hypothetical protein